MSAYVYASGQYHPLEGNQIVSGGQLVTMKAADEIALNGSRYSLGAETQLTVSNNFMTVSSSYTSARVVSAFVGSGGTLTLNDGTVDNLQIGGGGRVSMTNEECFGSPIQVGSGGTLSATSSVIKGLNIFSGGSCWLVNCSLNEWNGLGTLTVMNRTAVSNQIISSGGSMNVISGGTAYGTTVSAYAAVSCNGGTVESTTLMTVGNMYVYGNHGNNINDIRISNGGHLIASGYSNAYGGIVPGSANQITVGLRGSAICSNYGVLNSITVLSGGSLTVYSGGYALNVVSSAGAVINVLGGGVITYANENN